VIVSRAVPDGATFRVLKLDSSGGPEGLARDRQLLHQSRAAGHRSLVGLYCFDRAARKPIADVLRDADALLSAIDLADVNALYLGEENVPWEGGLETLNALYTHIKSKASLPVYQWYTAPLPPHCGQLADGWIINTGDMAREALRTYLIKYLVTGKPVLNCAAAAPRPNELVALCRDLSLPASFFGLAPELGAPAARAALALHASPRLAQAQAYSLDALWRRLPPSADRSEGQGVEVGGDRVKRYEYIDSFHELWCIDDPTIEGVSSLRWDGAVPALHIEGRPPERRRVSLTYRFASPFDMKELIVELEGDIQGAKGDRIELAISYDGESFLHPAHAYGRAGGNAFHLTTTASYRFDGPTFWVRVQADLAPQGRATLTRFKTSCRVKPPGRPEVALSPAGEGRLVYRDTFASSKILHLAEIQNPKALEWRRGGIFIRGHQGEPVQVVLRQRFLSPEPLRSLAVRVRNAANQRDDRASNLFGISLDGTHLIAQKSTPDADGVFRGTTELRVDDPALLAQAQQFYLHITLANGAGVPTDPSNILSRIDVEANAATRTTATAAAPAATIGLR